MWQKEGKFTIKFCLNILNILAKTHIKVSGFWLWIIIRNIYLYMLFCFIQSNI